MQLSIINPRDEDEQMIYNDCIKGYMLELYLYVEKWRVNQPKSHIPEGLILSYPRININQIDIKSHEFKVLIY